MPDKQEQTQEAPKEPTPEEAEAAFWKKHEERTLDVLNTWFEERKKEFAERGTSRTGGRATIPGILATFMFGPEKKD